MALTQGEGRVFINKLGLVLQDYERRTGCSNASLEIHGIAPDGPQVGHDVTVGPPTRPVEVKWAIDEIRKILTEFESETGLWVDRVQTGWTREDTPQRLLDCSFRMSY